MVNTSDIMGARDRDPADEVCEGAGRHLDRLSGRRDGLLDLVSATGIWSNVEIMWEHPLWAYSGLSPSPRRYGT
jgi:hypothetical protein